MSGKTAGMEGRGPMRRRSWLDASDVGTDLKQVLIPADRVRQRIGELAAQIDADYAGRELLLVGVLKGAVMVMADLARALHLPVEMDWMAISSYGSGTRSSGVVRILKDLDTDITGRHMLSGTATCPSSGRWPPRCTGAARCRGTQSAEGSVDFPGVTPSGVASGH